MSRRVVVTGVGLLSPLGIGTDQSWQAICEARNGISLIQQFDTTGFNCRIAGEVKDFDPTRFIEKKEIKKMGRFIQFGIAASEFALAQSGLKIDAHNAERVGIVIGSGIGGFEVIEREHRTLLEKGPSRISPFFIPATIINLASGWVSIRTGAKGPNSATATACTTSAHSIGDSFKIIQRNDADDPGDHGPSRRDADIGGTSPGLEADTAARHPDQDGEGDTLDEAERKLIERHRESLSKISVLATVAKTPHGEGGRTSPQSQREGHQHEPSG